MNLIKSLQKTQTQRAEQPVPGQAANLKKMLAAKSGKAGATTGPVASSIQEQQALKDFGAAATTQQQQAQLNVGAQQQQQAAQEQAAIAQQQQLQNKQAGLAQGYAQAVEKIESGLDRLGKDIESREDRAALNSALFTRRLHDKDYVSKLNREGTQRRLEDKQAFAIEAGKAAFDNWNELFENEEEFSQALFADEATFRKNLAKMSVEAARAMLADANEAANKMSNYTAAGTFVTTAVEAGGTKYKTDDGKNSSFFERMKDS
jgi:hypothetical protein